MGKRKGLEQGGVTGIRGDRLVKTDITMKDMCTMYGKMIDVLLIIKKALPVNVYNEMTENRCTLFDFISAYKKYEVV